MLRTRNGEARKHGMQPTSRFQLRQTSVNILIFSCETTSPGET